ncbi:MAG: medium chain dehydrogenase/reductase family protein [Myxococcota bacterium]
MPASLQHPAPASQAFVRFTAFGSPDTIEVVNDAPIPEPGPGQIRVRVEASSVQFTDTLIRGGFYPDLRGRPPFTLGYDLVGRVDALGADVDHLRIGDRVAELSMIGGNARYILCSAVRVVPVPDTLDAAEATTLVLSWMSAHQSLFHSGRLTAGERLLVIGGNGAVGRAAIRLAVEAGCTVWATGREKNHDLIRSLGATPLPRDGWQPLVRDLGGVDVVLDGIAADGFRSTYRALRRGGRLVAIGFSAAAQRGSFWPAIVGFARLGWWTIWPDGRSVSVYSITKRRQRHPDDFRADLSALFDKLEQGQIKPLVEERMALDDVADAHRRIEAGGLRGKLVVLP